MNQLYIKTRSEWRKWLRKNHDKVNELWLIFYKKETGKPSIDYEEAVEEALCYGWIDSLVKKIDAEKYARKFTPRKKKSMWSEINKKRVRKVIQEDRMTKYGLVKIEVAKKNGSWDKQTKNAEISYETPKDFIVALDKNKKAKSNFDRISSSQKKRFYMWINIAKKEETRERRIKESIELLGKNKELGLK
jgi:uncharacterized protein YdeI (YjbR/CyaY-like superfamily)